MLTTVTAKAVATILLVAASAHAQQVSACARDCVSQALNGSGCGGPTDLACLCTNSPFQAAFGGCLSSNCPGEVTQIQAAQRQQCIDIGINFDHGGNPAPPGSPGGPPTQPSPDNDQTPPPGPATPDIPRPDTPPQPDPTQPGGGGGETPTQPAPATDTPSLPPVPPPNDDEADSSISPGDSISPGEEGGDGPVTWPPPMEDSGVGLGLGGGGAWALVVVCGLGMML